MKITDDDIKKWEEEHVKGKKARHMDETLPGFFVNETAAGDFAYYFRMRDSTGRRYEKQIAKCGEMTVGKARNYARSLMPQVKVNGMSAIKKIETPKSPTAQQLYEKWKQWAKAHPKSKDSSRKIEEIWGILDEFYTLRIGELSAKDIQEKLNNLLITRKAATLNRYVTELKFLVRWGIDQGLIEKEKSHWHEISKIKELDSTPKTDHFTDEERKALRKAAELKSCESYFGHSMAYIKPLIELLFLSGLRPGSALGLKWADLDFQNKIIRIRKDNIKTQKAEILPISDHLLSILKNWQRQTKFSAPTDFIFSNGGKRLLSIKKPFASIVAKAEENMGHKFRFKPTPYSLRHDCASEILRVGGTLSDVQHTLLHASPVMSNKYAHATEERTRAIAERLAGEIQKNSEKKV